MKELQSHLLAGVDPTPIFDIDAVVAFSLRASQEEFCLHLSEGTCSLTDQRANWTIYFADEASALALFRGQVDPIQLFMQNALASSGYIVTTFRVLRAFIRPAAQ